MNLGIKPSILVGPAKDHRHSVVDLAHERIGPPLSGSKNEHRSSGVPHPPSIPNPGDTHDGFIIEVNCERAFSSDILLPFEESAYYAGQQIMPNQSSAQFVKP
jgi:hypothetical protein